MRDYERMIKRRDDEALNRQRFEYDGKLWNRSVTRDALNNIGLPDLAIKDYLEPSDARKVNDYVLHYDDYFRKSPKDAEGWKNSDLRKTLVDIINRFPKGK